MMYSSFLGLTTISAKIRNESKSKILDSEIVKLPWDVSIDGIKYQVIRFKCINSDIYMYPRYVDNPTYADLVECKGDKPLGACWGIKFEPRYYHKFEGEERRDCCYLLDNYAIIMRNGKDFYRCSGGIDEARYLINTKIPNHPLHLNYYDFENKAIGRKIWWKDQPAVIIGCRPTGEAVNLVLKFDGIGVGFKMHRASATKRSYITYREPTVELDIFDESIGWYRE